MLYSFQSKNTSEYVVTTTQDVNGDVVRTITGQPVLPGLTTHFLAELMLLLFFCITGSVTEATIKGFDFNHLYVAYQKDSNNAGLTWSDKEYKWIIRETPQGTKVITPANGDDLYWVGEVGVTEVLARPGKDIRPPQNEWIVVGLEA
ncbi:hypothetical protein BYT27DRAFT_7215561 [Phlegmacium glaucopus]|nr:hypothetical protein BYT27DRAFT_7215561 [Phlegmacium glaucopus]